LVTQCNSFQLHGNFDQLLFACHLKHLICNFLDNLSSGIIALIYPMTKSIEQLLSILYILDKLRNVLFLMYLLKHP
jgi:hypothetical protein